MPRALLLLPALLLAAACGGGGDEEAKAAYLERAEAVCAQANAAQTALTTPSAPDAIPAYVRSVVTVAGDASAALDGLEPPEGDRAEIEEKFLAPLREQVALGRTYADEVEATSSKGDTAGVLRLLGSAPLQTRADLEFLRGYGFRACVEAADTSS